MDMQFVETQTPLEFLPSWLEDHKKNQPREPLAMVVSTVSSEGHPSSRILLLKELHKDHLIFFTNYMGQKGQELEATPYVALNFYFEHDYRQVRIEGTCEKTSRAISEKYWSTRPRESQLSQWSSQQSQPVADRTQLEEQVIKTQDAFASQEVPCPEHWGGQTWC